MKKILVSIALLGMVYGANAHTKECNKKTTHKYAASKKIGKADPNVGLVEECGNMRNYDLTADSWTGDNTIRAYAGYRTEYAVQPVHDPMVIINFYNENLAPRDNAGSGVAPQSPNSGQNCSIIAPQSPNQDACGK